MDGSSIPDQASDPKPVEECWVGSGIFCPVLCGAWRTAEQRLQNELQRLGVPATARREAHEQKPRTPPRPLMWCHGCASRAQMARTRGFKYVMNDLYPEQGRYLG